MVFYQVGFYSVGKNMELVQFTQEHFATLASWFPTEADLIQWGGPALRHPLDEAQMEAMLAEARMMPPGRLCWMGIHKNHLAGHAQLAFDWKHGNAKLARVAIAPLMRGQDLAVAMLRLVMAQAFQPSVIMRLELNVYDFNQAAMRVYRSLGFQEEGNRRSSVIIAGRRHDTIMMGMLRSEWVSRHP